MLEKVQTVISQSDLKKCNPCYKKKKKIVSVDIIKVSSIPSTHICFVVPQMITT